MDNLNYLDKIDTYYYLNKHENYKIISNKSDRKIEKYIKKIPKFKGKYEFEITYILLHVPNNNELDISKFINVDYYEMSNTYPSNVVIYTNSKEEDIKKLEKYVNLNKYRGIISFSYKSFIE
jgi:hypothetical protein